VTRTIQAVERTCALVEHLRTAAGRTVSELADETGLAPGTVHTHLATLKEANYVRQEGDTYRLGPQLLTLGEHFRNNSAVYRCSKDQVEALAAETGESAHLIVEHDGRLFALYERFGEAAVGVDYHDRKREHPLNHLHCTAAGKAILAHRPDEEVRSILDRRGMPQTTANTVVDPDALCERLDEVRDRGYAFADEEQIEGIRAVGAPITVPGDGVVGAVAVSGPASRLSGDRFRETLPERVVQAADVCAVNLHTSRSAVSDDPT
jgi:DNA-binding IclR family transcriptional regulator